jgi:hypothetical protein
VADIKSERWPASDRNRWPDSYWNAWPASSEAAIAHRIRHIPADAPQNHVAFKMAALEINHRTRPPAPLPAIIAQIDLRQKFATEPERRLPADSSPSSLLRRPRASSSAPAHHAEHHGCAGDIRLDETSCCACVAASSGSPRLRCRGRAAISSRRYARDRRAVDRLDAPAT